MNYIMVIDDSPTIRTSVEYVVKKMGREVRQAENGSDALQKIGQIKEGGDDVALCIVDVNMPVMDGITFIREFRKEDRFTPVLVLTTESDPAKVEAGRSAGASGWIVKPFKEDDMKNTIEKLIR